MSPQSSTDSPSAKRVLVAGATGYVGKFAVQQFKRRGYWVRVLTRSESRLRKPGPFTAPGIDPADCDDVFVGEVTKPETLEGLMDGIDVVFSSVGISRQRDGLTFEQVDYQGNRNLLDLCKESSVKKFVYVSMLGADQISQLAITIAHERVVDDLRASGLNYTVVRPSGFFSDMGVLLDMAQRGRVLLVGDGTNRFTPIHGRDLADICVDAAEGSESEVEAGGPDTMTQREAAELAIEVAGRPAKITVIPLWLAKGAAKGIGLLSTQFGDLAEFIVTAGEMDGVGPHRGKTTLRSYFEELARGDEKA